MWGVFAFIYVYVHYYNAIGRKVFEDSQSQRPFTKR